MIRLSQVLYTSIIKHRNNTAFHIEGRSYTYLQLAERVTFLQAVLLKNNAGLKSIGIIANQDFDTYSTIIAALLSGITYVPIEPTHPDERNNHVVRISDVKAIFCSDLSSLSIGFHEANKSRFIQALKGEENITQLKVLQSNSPAYILFTSGSTGVPKGVPISLQNLYAFTANVAGMGLDISEKSRFLQVFELTFDLSVFSYLVPLLYGASVYILPKTPFKQMAAIQLAEEHGISHVLTVPSFVSYLKPLFGKIKLPAVKFWLFCGEALKAELVRDWQKSIPNASVYNVYGPTEATIFCTSYVCDPEQIKEFRGIVSIGAPFKDILFGLFDNNLPVKDLTINAELCISGSQLTLGYLDDPGKNEAAFFTFDDQVYYRSGDLCHKDENGDYFFAGRNDTQVKISGYRVEISELEYHARDFQGIDEAVVIVTTNENNDQQVLNLVYTAKAEINGNDIAGFLAKRIPAYMMPGNIFFVPGIPYNLNGKIDKRALADQITKIKY